MKRRRAQRGGGRLLWVEAGTLSAHPDNWRVHDAEQKGALAASLEELGWLVPVVFNETTGRLIDGHARLEVVAADAVVPVFAVKLSEEQERLALATLDPLSAMAEADREVLGSLLSEVDLSSDAYEPLLADLAGQVATVAGDGAGETGDDDAEGAADDAGGDGDDGGADDTIYNVVVQCADEGEQKRAYDRVRELGYSCRLNTVH